MSTLQRSRFPCVLPGSLHWSVCRPAAPRERVLSTDSDSSSTTDDFHSADEFGGDIEDAATKPTIDRM